MFNHAEQLIDNSIHHQNQRKGGWLLPRSCTTRWPLKLAVYMTALGVTWLAPAAAESQERAEQLSHAISSSDVNANFRYRLEVVEQGDSPLATALASTLRSRIGVTTGDWLGWQGHLEVDNVTVLGNDRYNSTVNGNTQYAVVPDPAGTDVNQGWLRYRSQQGTVFTMGRQRLNMLNQRFIGGVGWRQNEQTFDGYRIHHHSNAGWVADVSRVHNVNRIFGPKGDAANQRGAFYNALVGYSLPAQHRLDGFVHDFDFSDWAVRSSRTYGVSYQGEAGPIEVQMVVARQQDAHANPLSFRHHYHRVQLGTDWIGIGWQLGQERLAGDGDSALQTPLATLHGFQGFADTFLVTPNVGLRDTYVTASFDIASLRAQLKGHHYNADVGSFTLGRELNLSVMHTVSERLQVLYKGAYYDARHHGTNTLKAWLMLSYHI